MNTHKKRTRELAKQDKRAAKDQKRAQRKAEARGVRAATDSTAPPTPAKPALPDAVAKWAAQPPPKTNARSPAAAAFVRRMNKTP
jgi:hypothetical protein